MTAAERASLAKEIAAVAKNGGANCGCAIDLDERRDPVPARDAAAFADLARYVDHALTSPEASSTEVRQFVAASADAGFRSVTVQPRWASMAVRLLQGRKTRVASLVGYPSGSTLTPAKCMEAELLLRLGVDELSMVADIGALRSGDLDAAFIDIRAVANVAACRGAGLNVVLELPALNERQRTEACVVARLAGASSAAPATALNAAKTTVADVAFMRDIVGGDLEVVATCAAATPEDAARALAAGASRVSCTDGSALTALGPGPDGR